MTATNPTAALRRDKYITLLPCEVEALGNIYVNQWPARKMFARSPGKSQVRVPVQHVAASAEFVMISEGVAFFKTPDGVEQQAVIPARVGELLYIDEPCTVVDVAGDVITFLRDADRNCRTIRDHALAKLMKPGAPAPRPLPMCMAREERLKVRAVSCQRILSIKPDECEAEGAVASNLTTSGNYIKNATRQTGFLWHIWWEKFPHLQGRDGWAFVFDVERFWP